MREPFSPALSDPDGAEPTGTNDLPPQPPEKPKELPRSRANPFPGPACEVQPRRWVATFTYTAVCPPGAIGDPVTVTRQAESCLSYQHALNSARALAIADANAEIECYCNGIPCDALQPIGSYFL